MSVESKIKLRKFPYPYRAGLAICSDIDYCDRETFIRVHQYLNDTQNGLGLPVADSFFGIGQEANQMAYFEKDGHTPSRNAELIRQAISIGIIDSIHSWGDFNYQYPDPALVRIIAENLNEDFRDHNLAIKIWINHGDAFNRQNLRARLHPSYSGDVSGSSFYTADLIRALGVTYYWWSEIMPWPLFGKLPRNSLLVWQKLIPMATKNMIKFLLNKKKSLRKISQIFELAVPCHLGDGSRIKGFSRFNMHPDGIWTIPTRHTFHYCLHETIINKLMRQNGYIILYTHLGLPVNPGSELFPKKDRDALVRLADEYHQGNIWVARTVDLLTYQNTTRYIEYRAEKNDEKYRH